MGRDRYLSSFSQCARYEKNIDFKCKIFCKNLSKPGKHSFLGHMVWDQKLSNQLIFSTVACKGIKCGKHQWCTIEKNKPKCACHLACHLEREDPVCGLHNGKPYRNLCAVRADECQNQKLIDSVSGPCKSKLFL